jgi:hypothetical protein
MPFKIRPGDGTPSGGFPVFAVDAREALDHVRAMLERGIESVEILDGDGVPYELRELERITSEREGGRPEPAGGARESSRGQPAARTDGRPTVAMLIALAEKKGYALAVSDVPDRWRLIGNNLRPVSAPDGRVDLTAAEAKAFLARQPDAV